MSACCGPSAPSPGGGASTPPPTEELLDALTAGAGDHLSMIGLAGGIFAMGSEDPAAYREDGEGPVRAVRVEPFAIAPTTVTVAQFAAFVLDTGHRTDAERYGDSLVFVGLLAPEVAEGAPAVAQTPWWRQVRGACWHRPEGPVAPDDGDHSLQARSAHPVTHVSRRDAEAYATWVGARLPTESEWEFAARGGLDQQPYPWGSERTPGGVSAMKTFQGRFPDAPTSPVGTVEADAFAPNGYGLYNATGNVWEWTPDPFAPGSEHGALRGGSYLCHSSYCRRYRTSARTGATPDSSLGHTGFRLALTTT